THIRYPSMQAADFAIVKDGRAGELKFTIAIRRSSAQGMPFASRSVPRRTNSLSTMFLVLSHERDGPLRYRLAARLETMPSSPSSAAALETRVAPGIGPDRRSSGLARLQEHPIAGETVNDYVRPPCPLIVLPVRAPFVYSPIFYFSVRFVAPSMRRLFVAR